MEFTDDEIAEYEEQLEDTDLKALLVDIASSNRAILYQLQRLNQALSEPVEESTEQYKCYDCGEIVEKDERQKHAVQSHNAPRTIPPEKLNLFEQV